MHTLEVLTNSQYVNNKHANKQLVNSENWSLIYTEVFSPKCHFESLLQIISFSFSHELHGIFLYIYYIG